MPLALNRISSADSSASFGNRLLLFILCLYLPEFALWTAFAEPGSLVLWGFWTPTILAGGLIDELIHVDRSSEWQFALGACTMICGFVALYWAARGIARMARRTRNMLTTFVCLLLASYSVCA